MATIKRKTKYKSKSRSRSRSVNKKFSKQRKIVRRTQKGGLKGGLKIFSGSSNSAMAKKGAKLAKATGQLSPATYRSIVEKYNSLKASGNLENKMTPHELLPRDLKSRNFGNFGKKLTQLGKKLTQQEKAISTIRTKYMQNQAKNIYIPQSMANKLAGDLAGDLARQPTQPAPPSQAKPKRSFREFLANRAAFGNKLGQAVEGRRVEEEKAAKKARLTISNPTLLIGSQRSNLVSVQNTSAAANAARRGLLGNTSNA
jgi:hypothetical protein